MKKDLIKIKNFLNSKSKLWDIFLLTIIVVLMVASLMILGWSSIFLLILLSVNIFIYLSYRYGVVVPGVSKLSNRYVLKSVQDFSKLNSSYFRFKFFYYFILLAHDIDSGFSLLFNEIKPLDIDFNSKKKASIVRAEYLKEALLAHHVKKKRATTAVITSSIALTLLVLVSTFIFSYTTQAATFGWIQSSWSGGIDTDAVATHPGDKTNWDKYYAKDEGTNAEGGSVSLSLTPSSTVETLDADFLAHSSQNTYVSGNQVLMLKPANATCSTDAECANNSCSNGICFACGTDTVAYDGGPYDANGSTQTVGGYYRTVLIDAQCWLRDNLNVGTVIGSKLADNATVQNQSDNSIIEKYCYTYIQQDNAGQIATGQTNCAAYGGLYQWQEVVQYSNGVTINSGNTIASGNIQGICPTGWHIPSNTEAVTLYTYLGGTAVAGNKLKATTTWTYDINGIGDNSSGFTSIAAGRRDSSGSFSYLNQHNFLWFATPFQTSYAWHRFPSYNSAALNGGTNLARSYGFAVRCLKD